MVPYNLHPTPVTLVPYNLHPTPVTLVPFNLHLASSPTHTRSTKLTLLLELHSLTPPSLEVEPGALVCAICVQVTGTWPILRAGAAWCSKPSVCPEQQPGHVD